MKEKENFDFACSRSFREGLPTRIDYWTSRTFSGADRQPSRTPRFRDQVLDDLKQEIRGVRNELHYWQQRAIRAEEDLRAQSTRNTRQDSRKPFEGPEAPIT